MSLLGELPGDSNHEAKEAEDAKRVRLYFRSRGFYKIEWYVQNYMPEKHPGSGENEIRWRD